MRTRFASVAVVLSSLGLLVACGDSHSAGVDAGIDAGGEPDAGPAEIDAARDAGAEDLDGAAQLDAYAPDDAFTRRDASRTDDGGPILPPLDAGDPFGDAGALGPPAWVDLEVLYDGTMCPALEPCGGDVVGTWDVRGGCVEVPVPMELMRCPGAGVTRATGRARGRVTFDGSTAHRIAQSEVIVDIFVPGLCASFVGGCAAIESQIRMRIDDARCVEDRADCVCSIRRVQTIDEADGYRIEGSQIVSATTGTRWDYCVEGDVLRYEEVTAGSTPAPIIELGRR